MMQPLNYIINDLKKKIMMNMKIYCMVKKRVPSQAQEYIPKGLNALTPKKLLSRLPLLLVQVKAVNNL